MAAPCNGLYAYSSQKNPMNHSCCLTTKQATEFLNLDLQLVLKGHNIFYRPGSSHRPLKQAKQMGVPIMAATTLRPLPLLAPERKRSLSLGTQLEFAQILGGELPWSLLLRRKVNPRDTGTHSRKACKAISGELLSKIYCKQGLIYPCMSCQILESMTS